MKNQKYPKPPKSGRSMELLKCGWGLGVLGMEGAALPAQGSPCSPRVFPQLLSLHAWEPPWNPGINTKKNQLERVTAGGPDAEVA